MCWLWCSRWDLRRQREEYERKKLLKSRHEASYLQPPRVQNKNKKPKADETATNGEVSLESLLQKALGKFLSSSVEHSCHESSVWYLMLYLVELQYIEILDKKAEALLLDQMSDISAKLKEAVAVQTPVAEKPAEKTPSSRARRTKEVQENKPPVEASADLNKSKSFVAKETALQTNTKANDNINNIIKTRKLLKSPVKSYPIIAPLWSTNAASESPKKSVLSTSYAEPRGAAKRQRKPSDAFLVADKNCSSGSSIYDDIDLDFRKLDNEDASMMSGHHLLNHSLALRQRPTTRSRSSSRSLSIDHLAKVSPNECDGENSNGLSSVSSAGLQAVPNQRKRQRKQPRDASPSSLFAKRSTKRIRMN